MEALLASVVLAMAVTAIVMPFTVGAQNEQVDTRRTLAVSLAQELMEEILTKPFFDPDGDSNVGPEPGESSRQQFDNADDYDGFAEAVGQIKSFDGRVIDGPAAVGLARQASAEYVYVSGQEMSEDPTFVRVVVLVKYRGDTLITLTRLVYAIP